MSRITVYEDGVLKLDSGAPAPTGSVVPVVTTAPAPELPPPDVLPPPTPAPQPAPADPNARGTILPGTDVPAGRGGGPALSGVTQDPNDKRTIRDLSVLNGPAIVEGPAGTVDYITITRPLGEVVEVTCGRTNSGLGAITSARMSCRGSSVPAGGSDCYGKISYLASGGADLVQVELLTPGALAVQRN